VYWKLDSAIVVMKAAEDGRRYNVTRVLDGAMDRSVLVERPMSPQLVIVGGILRQNPTQVSFAPATIWSTHSRRIDPISLSAKPFRQGARVFCLPCVLAYCPVFC
jgi:hypothetical protein